MDTKHKLNLLNNRACELMELHGAFDLGYFFKFNNSSRLVGYCNYADKVITISRPFAEINTIDTMINTVLHEIAHALTEGDGHGRIWKRKLLSIGGDGKRLIAKHKIIEPTKKYIAICNECKYIHNKSRLSHRLYSCGMCSPIFNPNNLLEYKLNTEYKNYVKI